MAFSVPNRNKKFEVGRRRRRRRRRRKSQSEGPTLPQGAWVKIEECYQKTKVFVIVLFIIGSHKEPSTGYSMKKRNFRLFAQTQHGLHSKANKDQGSSVERMAVGDQKHKVVHPARRMEAMSLDHHHVGPFDETNLDDDEIEVKEPLGLQSVRRIDVVHSIHFRLRPDGRRAQHALSRRIRGLYVSLSWVRTPKEGPGYNGQQFLSGEGEMIGKR